MPYNDEHFSSSGIDFLCHDWSTICVYALTATYPIYTSVNDVCMLMFALILNQ